MTEAEAAQAHGLVEGAEILSQHRITEAYGHLSVRCRNEEYLLTPRAGPGLATVESLLRVSIDTGQPVAGQGLVPLEAAIHTAIYRSRADVGAVARIHSFAATVVSVTATELNPMHYLGTVLGRVVPVHDLADLVLDQAAGAAVAAALGAHAGLLLRGNGQVVVGRSIEEATARALYLDESARLLVAARTVGPVRSMSDEEVERSNAIWADPVNIQRIWDYHRWGAARGR